MGAFSLLRQTLASIPTAGAGKTSVTIDATSKQLALKDESGNTALLAPAPGGLTPASGASLSVNTAAITTTETVALNYQIPANSLRVGTVLRVRGHAQGSGTAIGTGTVTVRLGTAGTTADTSIVASGNLALTIAAVGVSFESVVTVRSLGAGGTVLANIDGTVSGVAPVISNSTAAVAVNTTVQNYLDVTVKTTATTSAMIVTDCAITVDQW